MRKIISIAVVLTIGLAFATPASAFQFGFQVNNGNAAITFGFSDNRQENQYRESRPRNQWDNNYYQPRPEQSSQGQYDGPRFRMQGHSGIWGNASLYESQTGRICPFGGRKEYAYSMYVCRVE